MPPRTLSEKVERLIDLSTEHDTRLDTAEHLIDELRRRLDAEIDGRRAETAARLAERQASEVRIALLEHQVAELLKSREESGRRLWALAGPLVGAVVGAALAYLLRR